MFHDFNVPILFYSLLYYSYIVVEINASEQKRKKDFRWKESLHIPCIMIK